MPAETPLDRFVEAQTLGYPGALAEIRRGAKRSHWMWYIFPQLAGLGRSATARHFAIRSADEARAYLDHPVLGARYLECATALQDLPISDPVRVFGGIDALKLRSSLTLFEVARPSALLGAALDRWFDGERDEMTLRLLGDDTA
ncbi:MAG: DUF1810 domain-containing protein [Sphingomonadaceae bacterium]|nr:DUF1810 domain-containing protein [Sphingomonadaceae bacterium]